MSSTSSEPRPDTLCPSVVDVAALPPRRTLNSDVVAETDFQSVLTQSR
eukprot:CAMPEP_0198132386 /NCGR_PEP_ID=MMETSP1442-20131203/58229_1 /TAXON_ID= /ORGANISM="Craspedostauros australis, Strain CCMP3328" /LENGTH=47 /DNA_ID= /DNA_START= /DNA_END= /DNA_ORIENTATION=